MQRFAMLYDLKSKQITIQRIKFKTIRKCHLEQISPGWRTSKCPCHLWHLKRILYCEKHRVRRFINNLRQNKSPAMKKPLREGRVAANKCHRWKNSRVDNARVWSGTNSGFAFKVFGPAENWATIDPLPLHHFHPE